MEDTENKREGFLYSLDFFRFTPSKFLEQTVLGALISLATIGFSIYLIMHEIDTTLNNDIKNEILFENLHMTDLRIYVDIDLLEVPCDILDLRFTSKRGRSHSLERYRIKKDTQGKEIVEKNPMGEVGNPKSVAEALKEKQGCKVEGEFFMHFLSNNFYLGYGNPVLLNAANSELKTENFIPNLNHRINSLMFGEVVRSNNLKSKFGLNGLDTLKNHTQIEDRKDGFGGPYYHSYYIVAVPNVFDRVFGRILETFQYTASAYNQRNINSGITFRIDVSPIAMHYYQDIPNMFSFVVQLFSIIGGLFMVAKCFDTYLSCFWCSPNEVMKEKSAGVELGGL